VTSPLPSSGRPPLTATSLEFERPLLGAGALRLSLLLASDVDVLYVQRRLLEVVEELNDGCLAHREREGGGP
jgi:hypothetical protein